MGRENGNLIRFCVFMRVLIRLVDDKIVNSRLDYGGELKLYRIKSL